MITRKNISREMLSYDKKNGRKHGLRELFPISEFQTNNVAFDVH